MDAQSIEQEIGFYGGIDTDTEDRLLQAGDYRYALNCLNGNNKKDSFGAVENLKGDTLVSINLPAGTNRCIGACKDVRQNSVIYAVYNSNGNHSILRYFVNTNTIQRIISPVNTVRFMSSRFLNFQNDVRYRIWHMDIIFTNGQEILKWTDGYDNAIDIPYDPTVALPNQQTRHYNPPRSLNITLATNFTNNSILPRYGNDFGVDNQFVQNQFTDAIKAPPLTPPTIVFDSDITRNTNYFRGDRLVQIRYRYIYYDGEQSVWSPISKVGLPDGDENASGVITQNSYVNNLLKITYNTGHSTVYQVQLAVRFGNTSDWKLFDTIEKYRDRQGYPLNSILTSYTDVVYNYYNDRVLQAIAPDEASKLFDVLPIVAGAQSYLSNNIIAYGDILEGYDNVSMDVGLSYEYAARTLYPRQPASAYPQFFLNVIQLRSISATRFILYIPNNISVNKGAILKAQVGIGGNKLISYVVTEQDIAGYSAVFIANIQNWLTTQVPATIVSTVPNVVVGANLYTEITFDIPAGTVFTFFRVNNAIDKFPSFKTGAYHKFGVVYYDQDLRSGGVNTNDNMVIYIPFETEFAPLQGTMHGLKQWQIQVQIRNLAPRWAKYYQIVYGKSNLKKYVQTIIDGTGTSGDKSTVNIDPLLVKFQEDNKPTPINYTFENGDRIRFMTNTVGATLTSYIDTRIQALSTTAPFNLTIDNLDFGSLGIGSSSLVELYAVDKEIDTEVYWEIGEVYPVIYDQTLDVCYHGGGLTNQDPANPSGTPATTILTKGDTYVKPRLYFDGATAAYTPVESEDFSDFYESSDFDYGRVNANINNVLQKRLYTGIRWGGSLFENTNKNDLSSFNGNDYLSVKNAAGRITKLVQVGEVLKVIQEKDSGSLYVGLTVLQSPGGGGNVSAIDTKLGAYYPSRANYGTIFPGSVALNDRHLYFFDPYNGVFIRDAPNGQEPISDYKFVKGARDLGEILSKSPQKELFDVISYFDNQKGTYEFTVDNFGGADNVQSQTIAFHENTNRWKTYWSYIPEMYGGFGQAVLHFKNGQAWLQQSNPIYSNFFGVQYLQQIKFIYNQVPLKVKMYENISVRSTKKWRAAGANGEYYIEVPAWDLYPNGMKSRLLENKFVLSQSGWNAHFIQNALTPNFASEELALMNGDALSGYVLIITLENGHTEYCKLFFVKVFATTSETS